MKAANERSTFVAATIVFFFFFQKKKFQDISFKNYLILHAKRYDVRCGQALQGALTAASALESLLAGYKYAGYSEI